eukprot:TRINITY_DN3142_c0_g1_i18.p1 TRINITY_DN3142_c0_g1~~TRINITY_DN3142_c0_g1_i18.p1  ORF type:complete len:706 (-),score=49.10 TRINITY_DN3142_c0_g1_i18:813-2672(-)
MYSSSDISRRLANTYETTIHENATHCVYCEEKFDEKSKTKHKVWDHCHLTGKYRGAACKSCNTNARKSKEIPVYFHNGTGYDFNFVLDAITRDDSNSNNIKVINQNGQKVMEISWLFKDICPKVGGGTAEVTRSKLVFRDSCRMFNAPLDTLIKNLDPNERVAMNNYIKSTSIPEHIQESLSQKGVFPYSWFDHPDKLLGKGNRELKKHCTGKYEKLKNTYKEKWVWYDVLNNSYVSEEDFNRAVKILAAIDYDFEKYHEYYLAIDVMGLVDVINYNRKRMMEYYGLDFTKYISAPAFAWDAMLKMTKAVLPCLPDLDMYMFFEEKYGGFTLAKQRYAKIEGDPKNPTTDDTSMLYIDANNLYGWAMCKELPYSNFEWMNEDELNNALELLKTKQYMPNGHGCRLRVSIHFPDNIHDKLRDGFIAPCNRVVEYKELSEYQKKLYELLKPSKSKKLVSDLNNRTVVYDFEYLKMLISLGVQIKAIHEGVKFETKAWMKPFIDFNTEKRAGAKNDADRDLFKLMNNAVYGKTMENVRDRTDSKVIPHSKGDYIRKMQSQYNFSMNRLDYNKYAILFMRQITVKLDKPIYTGCTVLDYSKLHMADFYYNALTPHFGRENINL